MQQQMRQLVAERLGVCRRREVALRLAPTADRAHHPSDHLTDAVLAVRAAERAAEVLGDDDVGRQLRPPRRDLDVVLLEDDLALFVLDDGAAPLPLDGIEGIAVGNGEVAADDQAGSDGCRPLCRAFLNPAPYRPLSHRLAPPASFARSSSNSYIS